MNNKTILKLRNISIVFRNKGKKFNAVKNVNIDINEGEIFGLVGESGSGKTTLARSIVGVQEIYDGAVYLNDKLINGHYENLYKLNKNILKRLTYFENKLYTIIKQVKKLLVEIQFKIKKSSFNESFEIFNLKEIINVNQLRFIENLYTDTLNIINQIIENSERIMIFVKGISLQVNDFPKKLEESLILKQEQVNNSYLVLKNTVQKVFLWISNIIKNISLENNNKYKLNNLLKKIIENTKFIISNNDILIKQVKNLKVIQNENTLLTSPKTIKNKKLKEYYKKVYISRKLFYKECNKRFKNLNNDKNKNVNELNILKEYLRDFWSRSNIKINICIKILNFIKENNKIEYYKKLLNKLKDTDFERKIKTYLKDNKEYNFQIINNLWKEAWYIKNIIKRNVVKDSKLIHDYYRWKNMHIQLVDNDLIEFIEFLELPSTNEILKRSNLLSKTSKKERKINRKNIQMIFQDPSSSLNDRKSVYQIISEGLENYKSLYKSDEVKYEYLNYYNDNNINKLINIRQIKNIDVKNYLINKVIKSVGLLPEHLSRYPHEFSGGQRQRIGIARSLIMNPKIIVADEPISALDVSIRSQLLNLFKKFQKEQNITFLFVAHDLSVVRYITDRVAVIYHGIIVELAPADELFKNPIHPYTKSLISSIPQPNPKKVIEDVFVYDPIKEHYDYIFDLPKFIEIRNNHYVYFNEREINKYKNINKE
ncbi:ATP-binding cassette domain-containing protein [Spiroplasma turonicum]|uniref:Oligopeptide ABC transporter ATP-binding protein n=1 Tax=Spiroplasma turonicum TaxID=216946 RepID=A0A0K1P657_9MOLU|nr:ATP-binding cassette domain-containing protein [Spiroplasma turonicum]AKU79798.1 oligopeptide ABC transporter ATP-binding protein [Spiroplasma turonicum]ALX70816.1 oligopeptide ABC transporter ATP-binding protein [Spiroplasma turonicum]